MIFFMFEKKHHGFCVDRILGIRMANGQVSKKRDKLRCCCNNSEKNGGSLTRDIREEVVSIHWICYILKRYPTKLAGCGVCRKDKKYRMSSRLDKGT